MCHQRDEVDEPRKAPDNHTLSMPAVLASIHNPRAPDSVPWDANPLTESALPAPSP